MQDVSVIPVQSSSPNPSKVDESERNVVATHVLVAEDQVDRLRDLSRRTRVAQSEYLREAVDDLLGKYHRLPDEAK